MPRLDPHTIILLAGSMSALMSLVLFFLRRNFPPSIKGLDEWTVAPAILLVSALLILGRGTIPDFFPMVAGNLTLLVGVALLYFGSQRFFGLPPSIRSWSWALAATALVLVWYTHVEPIYAIRLGVVTLFIAVLSFCHFRLVVSHGARSFATYLTATALLIQTGAQALRFATAFDLPADSTTFSAALVPTVYVTAYALCMLLVTIGVVLMATDKLRAEFEHLASHDSLTGALTRRALIDACEQELERFRRKGRAMSLLMVDLDHFKTINDTYGHLVGDQVLTDYCARVSTLLRRPDHFGRFGGEEFVVLLPETSPEEARIVAERIRAELESPREQPCCTVSIGIATSRADDATIDAVLARADAAMYRAKAAGRNRVEAVL